MKSNMIPQGIEIVTQAANVHEALQVDETVKNLKSPAMEKLIGNINKLVARKDEELKKIHDDILAERKKTAKEMGVDATGDTGTMRALTDSELARLEDLNALIFEQKEKLRDEKITFFTATIQELDRDNERLAPQLAEAEELRRKLADAMLKNTLVAKAVNRALKGTEKALMHFYPAHGAPADRQRQIMNYGRN